MEVKAKLNYVRIAPRKVRLVADLIRGKSIEQAQNILSFSIQKSARPIIKLLNQAATNAKNNFQLEPENLYISRITVDQGPILKRWRPRSRGQAYEIQKKTSHISLTLAAKEGVSAGLKKERSVAKKTAEQSVADKKIKSSDPDNAADKKIKKSHSKTRLPEPVKKTKTEKGLKKIFRRKSF